MVYTFDLIQEKLGKFPRWQYLPPPAPPPTVGQNHGAQYLD